MIHLLFAVVLQASSLFSAGPVVVGPHPRSLWQTAQKMPDAQIQKCSKSGYPDVFLAMEPSGKAELHAFDDSPRSAPAHLLEFYRKERKCYAIDRKAIKKPVDPKVPRAALLEYEKKLAQKPEMISVQLLVCQKSGAEPVFAVGWSDANIIPPMADRSVRIRQRTLASERPNMIQRASSAIC
jgi:hypothetical protein